MTQVTAEPSTILYGALHGGLSLTFHPVSRSMEGIIYNSIGRLGPACGF